MPADQGDPLSARLGPTPTELLSAADDLLRDEHPDLAGAWPRAVAILCRQALEGSMFDLWRVKAPGVEDASYRAQLLLSAPPMWTRPSPNALTRPGPLSAELATITPTNSSPTAAELGTWLESVDELVRVVAKRVA